VARRLLIRGAVCVLPEGPERADILGEGGRIVAVGRDLEPADVEVFDATGLVAGPGFVDVHVHGGGGRSFFRADAAEVREYALWAPLHGVTSFLMSVAGSDADRTREILSALRPAIGCDGAEPLGFHLEGPFLNPARRGAFPEDYLRPVDVQEWRGYQAAAEGAIRQMTLAPELPGAMDVIEAVVADGVVAAMGHTDAAFAVARQAFDRGVTHVTHLFNAMRPLHQREGGPAAAALLAPGVTCELICDGLHVSEEMLALAARLLGPERMVCVTDNLEMAGAADSPGGTEFGGAVIEAREGVATRADGTIAGSLAPFDEHFRRVLRLFGGDLSAAFWACAANPARVAGVGARKGTLAVGADADIVLLDATNRVVATICRGEVLFDGRQAVQGD
jgi:N-acetylglucosamine-6-phosphate deacetylase